MTPEQLALLAAVRAAPGDDLPRLVYADWLEENAACDRDLATLEFIRLTCPAKRTKAGKPWRGARPDVRLWLRVRWKRLVPALLADVDPGADPGDLRGLWAEWADSRLLFLRPPFALPQKDGTTRVYTPHVWLTFDRGFVTRATFRLSGLWPKVFERVKADQPAAVTHTRTVNPAVCGLLEHYEANGYPPAWRPAASSRASGPSTPSPGSGPAPGPPAVPG